MMTMMMMTTTMSSLTLPHALAASSDVVTARIHFNVIRHVTVKPLGILKALLLLIKQIQLKYF